MGLSLLPPRFATDHLLARSVFTRRPPPARASITHYAAYCVCMYLGWECVFCEGGREGGRERELGRRCSPSLRPVALQLYRCRRRSSVHVAPKVSSERASEWSEEGRRINYVSQSAKHAANHSASVRVRACELGGRQAGSEPSDTARQDSATCTWTSRGRGRAIE